MRSLVLCRPDELNTITVALRDDLAAALDDAERDDRVRVVLLRAEGRAFSAGFSLDVGTNAQRDEGDGCTWDSMADLAMISTFARTWAKLHEITKPTVAAVQGWCVAGGTDLVFQADLVLASTSARFGYPPARVWGTPEAPWAWIARIGVERTKRLLFTGDEISGTEAAQIGLVLECVPDEQLERAAMDLAQRVGQLPLSQLQMMKILCNQVAYHAYRPEASRLLGCLFDGAARHSEEGREFVRVALAEGPKEAVRRRDAPFGDYGQRPSHSPAGDER